MTWKPLSIYGDAPSQATGERGPAGCRAGGLGEEPRLGAVDVDATRG